MLFNSYEFIFLFLPITLAGFFAIGHRAPRAAAGFLALASLFFYGWWSAKALPLLLGSIAFNYAVGLRLTPSAERRDAGRKRLLIVALALNLGLLGAFKYADFFIDSVNEGLKLANASPLPLLHLVLPIGISFYTFTQIAYLVDSWAGKVHERRFVHYALFVTYFPHLIAGPVLHHAQMMPQFASDATYRPQAPNMAAGLALFTFGLAKKLLLADPLGQYADLLFDGVKHGATPSFGSAWIGTLAYTLQIYYDFSGYSDMAIGLSQLFNVRLPLNFDQPYAATNIIDFWRRWHISLSNFLRDYLYIPLGGNRLGAARRYLNLFLTMLIGGLWHGAAWTFVAWGALHGAYLTINHLWRARFAAAHTRAQRSVGWLLTFVAVVLAWVVFRADGMRVASRIYAAMLGANGFHGTPFSEWQVPFKKAEFYKTFVIALLLLTAPDSIRWAQRLTHAIRGRWASVLSAAFVALLLGWAISRLGSHSAFLYFQF